MKYTNNGGIIKIIILIGTLIVVFVSIIGIFDLILRKRQ